MVIIDNYDSFTYNLYQYVAALGRPVRVVRNDAVTVRDLEAMRCRALIVSHGPGTPDESGITKPAISHFAGRIPILGVCLGHQAIGEVFGGRVVRGPEPVHGKASLIYHSGQGLYSGLPRPFAGGRYHSLIVDRAGLPACLEVTATTEDGIIMGLKLKDHPVEGVQFHPESVLTPEGKTLLANFFAQSNI